MTADDNLPEPKREEWNVDALWTRVRARTLDAGLDARLDAGDDRAQGAEAAAARRFPSRFPRRLGSYATAASLAIIAGAGALLIRARERSAKHDAAPGLYHTSRGQYATIRLADSTEVTLAPESRLTISARFAQGDRDLSLDGEAIFSVRHDAAHPFRVHARSALIRDVGTRFDLRAYASDAAVTVAVAEGSVLLGGPHSDSAAAPAPGAHAIVLRQGAHAIVLRQGEVGTLDEQGNASIERPVGAASYLGWPGGTLSFENRPLPEVLRAIARWYDLDVRVTDARLARRLVTAEFSRQSATGMIDALALAMDATVERHGQVITLVPK